MPSHCFCLWHGTSGGRFNFTWPVIRHDSIVVITVGEAQDSPNPPVRFQGDAVMTVQNIAPYDGGVHFHLDTGWGSPLDVWTSITVFDPSDGYVFGEGWPS